MTAIELIKRVHSNGLRSAFQSALSVVEDCVFDYRRRLETRAEVAIEDLDISQEDKRHADKYKPTRARYFRKLMAKVELPRKGVFVDVGSGKGRILLLAAEYGFERIVGLEVSPQLCQVAQSNINAFLKHRDDTESMSVVCTNILDYQLNGNEAVFFLYSPFDHFVTSRFLEMIRKSIDTDPRAVHLIINEFRFPELLANDRYFAKTMTYKYGAANFHVYSHRP